MLDEKIKDSTLNSESISWIVQLLICIGNRTAKG